MTSISAETASMHVLRFMSYTDEGYLEGAFLYIEIVPIQI